MKYQKITSVSFDRYTPHLAPTAPNSSHFFFSSKDFRYLYYNYYRTGQDRIGVRTTRPNSKYHDIFVGCLRKYSVRPRSERYYQYFYSVDIKVRHGCIVKYSKTGLCLRIPVTGEGCTVTGKIGAFGRRSGSFLLLPANIYNLT